MSGILIALRNVTFGYEAARPVLRNAALEIRPGDRAALAGRNGAGKTTLLYLLVGLLRPQAGHVEAMGRTCRHEEDFVAVRRRVALLFQNSEDQLFCPTVLEDVAFGPLNLGQPPAEARQSAMDALAQLGMSDFAERVTHHLSVGEKKLVALATILSMKPSVLLLDEPTAGLDENAVERVVALLNGLDAAWLVISQDHDFLARVTSRRLTLADGAIHERRDPRS
jgi:cobalt/nickel transport system ATP-binding protein